MRIKWHKWRWSQMAPGMVLGAMLLASIASGAAQDKPFPELDQQVQLIKNQFNADVGKVRVLLILDPT